MTRENSRKRLLVSWAEIEQMVSAAAVIGDCRCELAARNRNIVSEVLADNLASEWRHYPDGEVYDPKSHAQYFFHTHPVRAGLSGSTGIFILFCVPTVCQSERHPLSFPKSQSPTLRHCHLRPRRSSTVLERK